MSYARSALARRGTLCGVLCVAVAAAGCASSGAVPKPFPGATAGPGAAPPESPARPPMPATSPGDAVAREGDAPPAAPGVPVPAPFDANVNSGALATALDLRGVPYRNGGSDPTGFDCSGLVQWAFARNGRALPRETREQFRVGREIDRDDVRPGDLLFFDTSSRGASHVGIALDHEHFVHAPRSNGVVRIERYTSNYWTRRYLGARRVE